MSLASRPQNKSFGIRTIERTRERRKLESLKERERYNKNEKRCSECNKSIPYEKRQNMFCSSHCSATRNNRIRKNEGFHPTEIQKDKTRRALIAYYDRVGRIPNLPKTPKDKNWKQYRWTKELSEGYPHTRIRSCKNCQKYHSDMSLVYCVKCSPNIHHYRSRAAFRFSVYEFPAEFDLVLINRYGWYSPTGKHGKNRKNLNLTGVSRDHLYTIADGFQHNIDPIVLAHPANCVLMLHAENNKKRKSSIPIDELFERIKLWEQKYGGKRRI